MNVDEMSVDTIQAEIEVCQHHCARYGWEISEINRVSLEFTVQMISPVDKEIFLIRINFKNYPEWPLYLEFIEPDTKLVGTRRAYPKSKKFGDLFHSHPCICHPASRKAYTGYSNLHGEWSLTSWKQNPQVGTLINLNAILEAIYYRINNEEIYNGRMI